MYRPKFRPQYPDPTTTLDWQNCTMASAAMALDFHTLGKVQKWGGQLRTLSGDKEGGTNVSTVVAVWKKLGYTFTDRRGKTFADLIADLKAGRGVVIQGDYDTLVGDDTCQASFNGDHAMYVNPEFFDGGKSVAVADPLCKGYKRIRVSELKKYAEKLGKRVYGDSRIFYGVTRSQAPAPKPVPKPVPPKPVVPPMVVPPKPVVPPVPPVVTPPVNNTAAIADAVKAAVAPLNVKIAALEAQLGAAKTAVAACDARIVAIKAKTTAFNADIQND